MFIMHDFFDNAYGIIKLYPLGCSFCYSTRNRFTNTIGETDRLLKLKLVELKPVKLKPVKLKCVKSNLVKLKLTKSNLIKSKLSQNVSK